MRSKNSDINNQYFRRWEFLYYVLLLYDITGLINKNQTTVAIDCEYPRDTEIVVSGTIIISQNYPDDYEHSKDCEITVRFHKRVRITFLDFQVEQSTSCGYDYLTIFDGPTSSSSQIGSKLCGIQDPVPAPIQSTGNSMTLIFHTDGSVTRSGFKLRATPGKYEIVK